MIIFTGAYICIDKNKLVVSQRPIYYNHELLGDIELIDGVIIQVFR